MTANVWFYIKRIQLLPRSTLNQTQLADSQALNGLTQIQYSAEIKKDPRTWTFWVLPLLMEEADNKSNP